MSFARAPRSLALLGCLALLASAGRPALATPSPASGSVTPATTSFAYAGGLLTGANVDETTCQENVTCESFVLTVQPGDYTGKMVRVHIEWLQPGNDYDLYIHEGSVDGPVVNYSADGTTTSEETTISFDPPVVPVARTFYLHVVAFVGVPLDPYAGTVSLVAAPAPRVATYVPSTIRFSPNVALIAPVTGTDGEPSIRCDVRGNCYVGGIEGVPAGVDLWRFDLNPASPTFDPGLTNATYLSKPDAFFSTDPEDTTAGGADGGGDIDLSVSFPTHPDSLPVLTVTSLSAASITSAVSVDKGVTYAKNDAVGLVPSDDRMWNESDGPSTVYMMYRAPVPATGLFCAKSTDNGRTFTGLGLVSATGTTPGYLDVDHADGTVYIAHTSSSALFVSKSVDGGLTWTASTVDNVSSHGNLFDVVKVGRDGTVYCVWSDATNVYMAHSLDHGETWSTRVRVSDNTDYHVNLLPWIAAGDAGRVAVVWYATTNAVDDDAADWDVRFAQSLDATAPDPTFTEGTISDHIIHATNLSLGGLDVTEPDNRNLLDYFQIALDPQGAAVIAFTDDHNDFDGNVYVTRQLDGPSLYANANGSGTVASVTLPPAPAPDPGAPQVVDFLHDAQAGLLQTIVTDSPYDVLSVRYGCGQDSITSAYQIIATMSLSALAPLPPAANWRMNFTANAPGGLSDRGDQFWVKAHTDGAATVTYTYGTAVRSHDGSIAYTSRGTADFGVIDSVAKTITIGVSLNKLNAYVTHGPLLGPGAIFHGLRGAAYTDQVNAIRDVTRGGTSYRFGCGIVGVKDQEAGRVLVRPVLAMPHPSPAHGRTQLTFSLPRAGFTELSVFDTAGRRVRTLVARPLPGGDHTVIWDGRTDRFSDAAPGVYVVALHTGEGIESQRVTLLR